MENTASGFSIIIRFAKVLFDRRLLIFLGTLVPTLAAIVIVLVSTSVYKSTALVNPPRSDQGGQLGALSGATGLGSMLGSILGNSGTGINDCLGILGSDRFAELVITRFDLETVYEFKENGKKYYRSDVIKKFRKMVDFKEDDYGSIQLSAKDESAERAKEMLEYMVFLLDSLYTDVQRISTIQQLGYADRRLKMAEQQMHNVEDSLISFQGRHNLLIPDAQMRLIVESTLQTELQLESVKEEMEMEAATRGRASSRFSDLATQKRLLEASLEQKLKRERNRDPGLILPANALPELATEYFRLQRAYAVRLGVYKYLIQQVELLKLEADRNVKVISVLDPPWTNHKRVSPKRRVVVQATFIVSLFACVLVAVLADAWRKHKDQHPESARLVAEIRRGLIPRRRRRP